MGKLELLATGSTKLELEGAIMLHFQMRSFLGFSALTMGTTKINDFGLMGLKTRKKFWPAGASHSPECGSGQIDRCAAGCAPKGVKFCEFSVVGQNFPRLRARF